jgi:thiamine monophosphate synthase
MDYKILFEIKKFRAPPVFFTDRKKISDFEKIIKILPKNSTIIIREYDLDKKKREDFARNIVNFSHANRAKNLKIIVGKDFALARKIKADGVHFSDFDKLPQIFLKKKSFPKKFIFSFACHNFKSTLKALKLRPDMIFISPIFSTTSHLETKIIGLKNLRKISLINKKQDYFPMRFYALGGINSDNIKSVRKTKISSFGAINLFNNIL